MLMATKVKMSGSAKKVNRDTYNISSIKHVTRKFLEVSCCSRAKQQQRHVQKRVLHMQSYFFCYLNLLLLFFTVHVVFTVPLALHDFIFCLSKL